MDFTPSVRSEELSARLNDYMTEVIYPAEAVFDRESEELALRGTPWAPRPVMEELKAEAKARGLWNLFLTPSFGGTLSNSDYAPLAEISGRSPLLAPEAMNCSAPDTGNMEVLAHFGTDAQKKQWLEPLLEGKIRSAFAMTEPDVASSDAFNIATRITRDGDEYVINGRKWWTSGALSPLCRILIVMGKTDPDASRHEQQSMVLVPIDTPGVKVVRHLNVFGYDDAGHGGHALVEFTDVRVPAANLIGKEGHGFAISQARLGPGRIHHCMRAIGMAERALELLCARADGRTTFGQAVSQQGVIRDWIAESRIKIEQARLLVLKTAWLMDKVGNKGAHTEIQAIKILVPAMAEWVLDKAIQVHGGGGVSQDFPLAALWAQTRTLRLADGPDEVHKASLGRRELHRQRALRDERTRKVLEQDAVTR
ncbi:acyl-CoA dehydrogenase family protein [Arthrobacter sp. ISL-28]|uniref:acyl-CoA dehydrogenase family protein n=1 Tax=Arthrobacter sp. ISL-28 TaxID=2819108 RepID=UPI001BEA969F|nr:acyl-CoA dehydrogenase family protein [Arthrobacter sp. ISL-28]MBT2523327.1 acyl-CoA dehydrogenase family protein [Arthrobacter sp. ISL-28]